MLLADNKNYQSLSVSWHSRASCTNHKDKQERVWGRGTPVKHNRRKILELRNTCHCRWHLFFVFYTYREYWACCSRVYFSLFLIPCFRGFQTLANKMKRAETSWKVRKAHSWWENGLWKFPTSFSFVWFKNELFKVFYEKWWKPAIDVTFLV